MPLTRGSSGLVRAPKLLYTNSIGRSAEVFIYLCLCDILHEEARRARMCPCVDRSRPGQRSTIYHILYATHKHRAGCAASAERAAGRA